MTTFSQRDLRWRFKPLGASGHSVGSDGCLLTAIAFDMKREGINTDPGKHCDWCNKNHGFTNDGLYYHNNVRVYTQGKLTWSDVPDGKKYTLIQVKWGQVFHWVAKVSGIDLVMDPLDGNIKNLNQNYWKEVRRAYLK